MMKIKTNSLLFLITIIQTGLFAQVPKSIDLLESGENQQRDLSIKASRIVLNPFNFDTNPQETTPASYNNKPTLPLNGAYLSTLNEFEGNRFGRQVKDLLVILNNDSESPKAAITYETSWCPHALFFNGEYENGIKTDGCDFFYDENTVVRKLSFNKKNSFVAGGVIPQKIKTESKSALSFTHANFNYLIAFNVPFKRIRFYPSEEDMMQDRNELENSTDAKWWAVEFDDRKELACAVTFAEKDIPNITMQTWAKNALKPKSLNAALKNREKQWDDFLQNVPHPQDFALHSVDAKGVTADDVRLAYYKAWVSLEESILMPDEKHFPYYQFTTGKASLWDHGHHNVPFAAAWEAFVSMQLYGFINPEISWSALKGLLSLVDETGMLGGESLPSKKAKTAWILYQQTGDKESLKEVYPALTRYLNWRIQQPRWIYLNYTPENEKDAEFVVEALTDIKSMQEIAAILGLSQDVKDWKKKYDDFFAQYLNWFWTNPQSLPVQHLNQYKERDTFPIQITTGLYLDELSGDYLISMLGLVYKYYDTDKYFSGFEAAKYPDVSYTVYGLINKNKTELAKGLLEANIRDIVRSNIFAETYYGGEYLRPGGVRPSIFGLASIIDFVWLKNNFFYEKGIPCLINIFNEKSGISNITINKKQLNIEHQAGSQHVEISGNYLPSPESVKVNESDIIELRQ